MCERRVKGHSWTYLKTICFLQCSVGDPVLSIIDTNHGTDTNISFPFLGGENKVMSYFHWMSKYPRGFVT